MTTGLATVREDEPLENALALMTGGRLKRLSVLGGGRHLPRIPQS
ncbi:MAG: hypothetical protein ACYC33_09145 [Thermoleophilia bacterium]